MLPNVWIKTDQHLCIIFIRGQYLTKRMLVGLDGNISIYSLTYLLTPRCRVLLEKLTGLQLVKKFPAFHGTRRFITALTSVRHLSLSWASPIQTIYPHPTSWRSILILSALLRLGLPSNLLLSDLPSKTLYTPFSSPIRATCPAQLILLDFITRTILGEEYKSFSSALCSLLHSPVTSSLPASFPPAMSTTKFHTHTKQQASLVLYILIVTLALECEIEARSNRMY